MNGIVRVRWALVALTGALALALVANGDVLIGALVAAITVCRVVMVAKLQRRRDDLRRRSPGMRDARP